MGGGWRAVKGLAFSESPADAGVTRAQLGCQSWRSRGCQVSRVAKSGVRGAQKGAGHGIVGKVVRS